MAIQRAEAQTSTLAKLAPPHTAAHKLSHQLLNFRSCTSPGCYQFLFYRHPATSTHRHDFANRCVGRTLTIQGEVTGLLHVARLDRGTHQLVVHKFGTEAEYADDPVVRNLPP